MRMNRKEFRLLLCGTSTVVQRITSVYQNFQCVRSEDLSTNFNQILELGSNTPPITEKMESGDVGGGDALMFGGMVLE